MCIRDRYNTQLENVRNSKEYDHLSKEIEFETLEIELAEKHIHEYQEEAKAIKEQIEAANELLKEKMLDLEQKRKELNEIISETKAQEEKLREKVKRTEAKIDPRLLAAFRRIRKNARNGLAIVTIPVSYTHLEYKPGSVLYLVWSQGKTVKEQD